MQVLVGKMKPLLILLSETHITKDIKDIEISITNYCCVRCDSISNHTGGVAIYARVGVNITEIYTEVFGQKNAWFISAKITGCLKKGVYGVLYHSPNSSDCDFLQFFDNLCENVLKDSDLNIIGGDFNINMNKNYTYSKQLKDIITINGLKQLVKDPTRVTLRSETLIDLIITNSNKIIVNVLSSPKITDHNIIAVKFKNKKYLKDNEKTIKTFVKYNKDYFCEELNKINWEAIKQQNFTNMCISFSDVLINCINKMKVNKTIKIKDDNKWYSYDLYKQQTERDLCYNKFLWTKSDTDWSKYISIRNTYNYNIKKTQNQHIRNEITENVNDPKKLWTTLKSIIKENNNNISSNDFIYFENVKCTDKKEIANNFNNYFVDSVKEINNNIGIITNADFDISNTVEKNNCFKFIKITYTDLVKALKQMKSKSDPENIKMIALFDSVDIIGVTLVKIINDSFESGVFPENWKTTTIVPIPKVTKTRKCEEFRPINMLPSYEKLIEFTAKNQLSDYLALNKIIIEEQSGFRSNHSCETSLNFVIHEWKIDIENNKFIVAVFLDLKRAFETIDRSLLIKKLNKYGILETESNWFSSYLNNRSQKTRYQNEESELVINNLGVPQGSILGPDLFNIYINDILDCLEENVRIKLFADDTLMWIAGKCLSKIISDMNEQLEKLSRWLKINKLKLNVGKTKYMIITNRNIHIDCDVKIDNEDIERVEVMKYLGIQIDSKLNFKQNINFIIKKVSKKIYFLNRIKRKIPLNQRILLYKSIVAPHFDFCSSILYLASKVDMALFQKLQNKGMRMILDCNKFSSSTAMLEALQWLNIKQRITFNTMLTIFKIKNRMLPDYLHKNIIYNSESNNYNLRRGEDFKLPQLRKCNTQNNIFYKGLKEYNGLPNEIKTEKNIKCFKRQLSGHLKK